MTDLQILTYVRDHGGSISFADLINHGLSYPDHDSIADKTRIERLIKNQYLEGKTGAFCTVRLTKEGRLHLQELQQALDQERRQATQEAKDKRRQYRHDWLLAGFSTVFGAILGVLGTLLVQWLT